MSSPAAPIPDLIAQLELERIEVNLFRGVSPEDDGPRMFGGHVIAQALLAAYETVPDRACHSLHAYFIRPGDPSIPVLYEVDRARDGGSFTTRRVTAIQKGEQIFNLAASFQVAEDGFEHQSPMPDAPDPESVEEESVRFRALVEKYGDKVPDWIRRNATRPRPIDIRWMDPQAFDRRPEKKPAQKAIWMRCRNTIPSGDVRLHQALLAYASDMAFMETAMRVHGVTWQTPGMQTASLDHAMWFHRPTDFNTWHLYDQDSPSASAGRGFVRGAIYSQDGVLAASVAQDCLMRMRPAK